MEDVPVNKATVPLVPLPEILPEPPPVAVKVVPSKANPEPITADIRVPPELATTMRFPEPARPLKVAAPELRIVSWVFIAPLELFVLNYKRPSHDGPAKLSRYVVMYGKM